MTLKQTSQKRTENKVWLNLYRGEEYKQIKCAFTEEERE